MKRILISVVKKLHIIVLIYVLADLLLFRGFLYQTLESLVFTNNKNGFIAFVIGLCLAIFGIDMASAKQHDRLIFTEDSPEKNKANKIAGRVLGVILIVIGVSVIFYSFIVNR